MSLTFEFPTRTVIGTNADETLAAGEYPASGMPTGFGWDNIAGRGGRDVLTAGAGGSLLTGGLGNDSLLGAGGSDTLYGYEPNLSTFSEDDDTLDGGGGNDSLFGGPGFDRLTGGAGADQLLGESGNDTLIADGLDTYIDGGGNTDVLRPVSGSRFNDGVIFFVEVLDLTGCAEAWFTPTQLAAFLSVRLNAGLTALVLSAPGSFGGNLISNSTEAGSQLFGSEGNDTITVASAQAGWRVMARGGQDTITGSAFADTIDGGLGNDSMTGGAGDDSYLVNVAGDVVVEAPGGGTDTVYSEAPAWTLGANIEVARLFGAGLALTGTAGAEQLVANPGQSSTLDGAGGDDVLWGGLGAHTLLGGAGNDIIRGQDGAGEWRGGLDNDTYVIGHAAAVIIENPGEGVDTAWVTINDLTIAAQIEIIYLAGTATRVAASGPDAQLVANPGQASRLTGSLFDDVLWGSAAADTLLGGAGADTLRGQGGADSMEGGLGHDHYVVLDATAQVIEAADGGYDTVWVDLPAGTAFTLAANVEQGQLSGLADRLTGNAQNNLLVFGAVACQLDGGDGDDTLFGSGLADTLRGGAGNDTIYVRGSADTFDADVLVYDTPGWGYDAVAGFGPGQSVIDMRGLGISFAALSIIEANGNTQVEWGGSAILLFNVQGLGAAEFLF